MKQLTLLTAAIIMILASACGGGAGQEGSGRKKDAHEADTGYTGIKNYIKDNIKLKEVTYKNGIREGMTRTFTRAASWSRRYHTPVTARTEKPNGSILTGSYSGQPPLSMIPFMVTRCSTTRTEG